LEKTQGHYGVQYTQKGAFGKLESVHNLIKGAVMALPEGGKKCQLHWGVDVLCTG